MDQSQAVRRFKSWFVSLDTRLVSIMIGLLMGVVGGTLGLLLVTAGPLLTILVIVGLLAGLYVLT
ncbi:MAG: hypothetical protein ACFE0Q_21340, partial [Anaerolineae bacterium]